MTREECSKELRANGYNHTDSNRYAKIGGRKLAWAYVVAADNGFAIRYAA